MLLLMPWLVSGFGLPTDNAALFDPDEGGERFFVGTTGRPWLSGTFGCVRSEGWQMHEGLDIRPVRRDRGGEAVDEVRATADGFVAYVNPKPGLSTYGIYVVLQHRIDEIEIYSLYAHLASVRSDLATGLPIRGGETLGVMGRTAATREGISRDRAHLHFELVLLVNDHFHSWLQERQPGTRNDHRVWNGRNFLGIDPRLVLLSSHRFSTNFNLRRFISVQPVLCRVAVRETHFPWLQRYAALVEPAAPGVAERVVGYELHLDFNGVPVRAIPRTPEELPSGGRFQLLEVNEEVQSLRPCRRLVVKEGGRWRLGKAGEQLLDLMTYP